MEDFMVATAQAYFRQFVAHATDTYNQAKNYLTLQPVDKAKPYHSRSQSGVTTVLAGKARDLAIEHTKIQNQETHYQHINRAALGTIAVSMYHYGLWQNNIFLALLAVPIYCAHTLVDKAISGHFKIQKDAMAFEISRNVPAPQQQ
jgi:hypothetical protein